MYLHLADASPEARRGKFIHLNSRLEREFRVACTSFVSPQGAAAASSHSATTHCFWLLWDLWRQSIRCHICILMCARHPNTARHPPNQSRDLMRCARHESTTRKTFCSHDDKHITCRIYKYVAYCANIN